MTIELAAPMTGEEIDPQPAPADFSPQCDVPDLAAGSRVPTHEEIEVRAYMIWAERPGDSDPLDNWLQAERELRQPQDGSLPFGQVRSET